MSGLRMASCPHLVLALLASVAALPAQTPPDPAAQMASAAAGPGPVGFTQSAAAREALHVVVGRSIFLDTAERVRRVYIANPLVVDSYTANPHEIVLTSKAPGTSSVILWDEAGHMQSYLVSADVDVEDLALSMKRAMPAEDVQIHSRENHIVLTGTVSSEAKSEAAAKLAALYSKDVTNSLTVDRALIKQVKLKVRIIEVDRSKMNQFGFNFFSGGGSTISNTTTQQFTSNPSFSPGTVSSNGTATGGTLTVTDALNFLLFSSKLNVGATLADLENKQVLQILAEPTITTLSGEKANFLSGGEFPFPVVQGSSGGLTSITIQFRSYGVKVEFTPVVNADGTIELKVAPEVSALDYTNAVTISGYTIPALSTRKVDTQVTVNSGQSFAISGLLDKRTTDLFANTPGISNIPILGLLFRSKSTTHSNTELVIVVTPETVEPLTHPALVAEPKVIIPPLSPGKFDKSLPSDAHAILDKDGNSK